MGCTEGMLLGCSLGLEEGCLEGWVEGMLLGCWLGMEEGCVEGCVEGCDEGTEVGASEAVTADGGAAILARRKTNAR